MTNFLKLNFQTVSRQIERDPVADRRAKFRAAISEQRLVLAAAIRGEAYADPARKTKAGCVSACNFDPSGGVIGVQF